MRFQNASLAAAVALLSWTSAALAHKSDAGTSKSAPSPAAASARSVAVRPEW
jgi:hypothetical protein